MEASYHPTPSRPQTPDSLNGLVSSYASTKQIMQCLHMYYEIMKGEKKISFSLFHNEILMLYTYIIIVIVVIMIFRDCKHLALQLNFDYSATQIIHYVLSITYSLIWFENLLCLSPKLKSERRAGVMNDSLLSFNLYILY